jgi:hypothetical protein
MRKIAIAIAAAVLALGATVAVADSTQELTAGHGV